jgi:hypothetical protein
MYRPRSVQRGGSHKRITEFSSIESRRACRKDGPLNVTERREKCTGIVASNQAHFAKISHACIPPLLNDLQQVRQARGLIIVHGNM